MWATSGSEMDNEDSDMEDSAASGICASMVCLRLAWTNPCHNGQTV